MPSTAILWRAALVAVCALAVGLAACADRDTPKDESLRTVRWEAIPGATTYQVRGWSGSVLLFDVNTRADSLPWTPSLVRAASAFDTVLVRVQGLDTQDQRQGEVREIRVRPAATPGR